MSVLPIRQIGDPVLRTPSTEVDLSAGIPPRIRQLIQDMYATNDDAGGIGIAAPQVGVNLRIFTWDVEQNRGAVINPALECSGEPAFVPRSDEQMLREGCLSVNSGIYGPVRRFPQVVVTGVDENGEPLRVKAEGLLAACFQHELDHLDGKLFLDRLEGDARRDALRLLRQGPVRRNSAG